MYAVLYATQTHSRLQFYRCPLPLSSQSWSSRQIAFKEFRDEQGAPFDPAAVAWVNLQVSRPDAELTSDITLDIGTIDTFSATK